MSEQCLGASGTSLDAAKIRFVGATTSNSVGTTSETASVRDSNNNSNNNTTLNINNNHNRDSSSTEFGNLAQSSGELHAHKKIAESSKVASTTTTLEFVSGDTSEHYFTVASGTPFDYREYLFDNTNSDLLDSAGPTPPGSADGGLSSKNSSNADPVTSTNFDFDLSGEVSNRIPSLVTVGACDPGSDIGSPPIENATSQISLHQHRQQQQTHSHQQAQPQQTGNLLLFDTTMLDAGSCGVGGAGGIVGQPPQHGTEVHDETQQHSYVYNTPPPVLESSITTVQEHSHHHRPHPHEMDSNPQQQQQQQQQQQSYYTINGSENDPNNNPVVGPEDNLKMIHDDAGQLMAHHYDTSEQTHPVTDQGDAVFHHSTVNVVSNTTVDASSSNGTSAQQTSSMEFEHQQQQQQHNTQVEQQQQLQQQTHQQHMQQTIPSQLRSNESKNNSNEQQIDSNEPLYQTVTANSAASQQQQQQVTSFMPSNDGVLTLGTDNVISTHVGGAGDGAQQQTQASQQQQSQQQAQSQSEMSSVPNGSSTGTINPTQGNNNSSVDQQQQQQQQQQNRQAQNVYVSDQCSVQNQQSQQQQQVRQQQPQQQQQQVSQSSQPTRYVTVAPLRNQAPQQTSTSVTASNDNNAPHPQQQQQQHQQIQALPSVSAPTQIATLTAMPTASVASVPSQQIKQICVIPNPLASPNNNISLDCSTGNTSIPTFTTLITKKMPATAVSTGGSGSLHVTAHQPLHATTFPVVNTSGTGTLMFASKSSVQSASKSNVPTMIALPATQFIGTDTGQWSSTPTATYLQPAEYASTAAEALVQHQQHPVQNHQTLQAYPVVGSQHYERLPDDGSSGQHPTQIFLSPGTTVSGPGQAVHHSNIRLIDQNYSIVALQPSTGVPQSMSGTGQHLHAAQQAIHLSSNANKQATKVFITTQHSDDGQTVLQQHQPQHAQLHAQPTQSIHLQSQPGSTGGNTLFQLTSSRHPSGGSNIHPGLPSGSIILSSINYNVAGASTGQPIAATNFAVPIPVVTMGQATSTLGGPGQQVVFTTATPTNGTIACPPPPPPVTATKTKGKKSKAAAAAAASAAANSNRIMSTSSSKLNPPPLPSGDSAKPYKCSICNKNLASKNVYQLHLRSHSGEKPFECNVCNNRFSQKTSLTRHYRSHTGERPFPCSVCQKRFADKERIKIHMRIHTGEKPFSCQVCNKKFSQKSTVKRHMSVHTGVKPFKCETCGKGFANRGNLTAHTKTHQPANGGGGTALQATMSRPQNRNRNQQAQNRLVTNTGSQQIQIQNPISTTQVILNANGTPVQTGEVIAIKLNSIKPEMKTDIMELPGGQQFVVTPISQVQTQQQQQQQTQDRPQSQPTSNAPLSS